jgi:hypothetical protein
LLLASAVTLSAFVLTACATAAGTAGTASTQPPTPTAAASAPTPTPTPTPTAPPAVDELTLSTEGLGPLGIGVAPPASDDPAAMITFDDGFCADERTGMANGVAPGDPEAGMWVPAAGYWSDVQGQREAPFGVQLDQDERVARIEVTSPAIATDEGVRIGTDVAEVQAAYGEPSADHSNVHSDVYVVQGDAGTMIVEVAVQGPGDTERRQWPADAYDRVWSMRTIADGIKPYSTAGGDNIVNACFL